MEAVLAVMILIIVPILLVYFLYRHYRSKEEIKSLNDQIQALNESLQDGHDKFEVFKEEYDNYKKEVSSIIPDAEQEAERIISEASVEKMEVKKECARQIEEAKGQAKILIETSEIREKKIIKEAREEGNRLKGLADQKLTEAHELASTIEEKAEKRAQEIAGEAWEAKKSAAQYEATVVSMKNIIQGYGDEYLIPNRSLLDELAQEYDHKEAGRELAQTRSLIKSMIKHGEAADCDYVEANRRKIAIEFVLDAFNGKVDTIMSKVRHDNYGKLRQQILDAYRIVNHNGQAFRNARMNERYLDMVVEQLEQAVIVHELKLIDREEQRRIKEQIREEAKAVREFEKARKEAEKEEKLLQNAMAEARRHLEAASNEQKAQFESQLKELQEQLVIAEEKGQRAMSMAQQTKCGHVYVISNIGSFGEDIYKIGMTRRLEPFDRVKELGDASVPFQFDVHAMIYSDDAPHLEKALHGKFSENQVNKVNPRKEFFSLGIEDIKAEIERRSVDAHWTMQAEAREYRESVAISYTRSTSQGNTVVLGE